MDTKVVCVYVPGGGFTAEYVYRLNKGVVDHGGPKIACLTNEPLVGIETIPLTENYPAHWSKVELFKLTGPTLYLDLDTIIVGDLAPFLTDIGPLRGNQNWGRPYNGPSSAIMSWEGDLTRIFTEFNESLIPQYSRPHKRRGDDAWIQDCYGKPLIPYDDRVVSYKMHCLKGVPEGTHIVCFHGLPRPHEVGWNPDGRQAKR